MVVLMLIWLNQRSLSAVLFITVRSPLSSTQAPKYQITKVSENLHMNWRPNKHKLPKSKILLINLLYFELTLRLIVNTWYPLGIPKFSLLEPPTQDPMLRLLSIDDNRGGMEIRKTFCTLCTATEIPFFDELPREENHSFLSLIYYKERYYLFSSTFNVLCWTYYLMCLSHPLSLIRPAISKLWDLMTCCICT
jgi:hypothetical protein